MAETILGLMPGAAVMVIDTDRRVVVMRGAVYERHGHDTSNAVGRDLRDVIPAAAWARLGEHWNAALAGESRTLDDESTDAKGDYWLHFAPVRPQAEPVGAMMVAQDITDRVRGREQTPPAPDAAGARSARSARSRSGAGGSTELFDEAARVLHETLASDLIMVLETTPEGEIIVRASAGEAAPRPPGPSPELRRSVDRLREAGETLLTSDLAAETQFRAPGLAAAGMRQPGGRSDRQGRDGVRRARGLQPPARPRSPRTTSPSWSRSPTC